MITKELKNLLSKKQPISAEKEAFILKKGFKTGSTCFLNVDPFSTDVDLILKDTDFSFDDLLTEYYAVYPDNGEYFIIDKNGLFEFKSAYFKNEKGIIYNALLMDEDTFEVWKKSTILMKGLCATSKLFQKVIQDKRSRVTIFEEFKRHFI